MEKTIILALATGQNRFSASLTKLVENYAELLASQGLLVTAMEYLKLLESEGSSHELAILRERIVLAAEGGKRIIWHAYKYSNHIIQIMIYSNHRAS